MASTPTIRPDPVDRTIDEVRRDAAGCTACELFRGAARTIFGEGPSDASLMLVGEQPGDREDRAGHPFVGPAGRILDQALDRAEIDRDAVYLTNAVKHFRNEPRGKKRIHRKPALAHVRACAPWLHAEIAILHPALVVAMGATAVQALVAGHIRVTTDRGTVVPGMDGTATLVTVHPASILRVRDEEDRRAQMGSFVADLTKVHGALRDRR